jgi:23S rRNA U2552 (ribose-2'-O)-methylase RlmE/FtsJ
VLLQDEENVEEGVVADLERGYIDRERMAERDVQAKEENEGDAEKTVHVVLSDMSEPWPRDTVHRRSIDLPYDRMANTTGIGSKDHFMSIVCAPPPPSTSLVVTNGWIVMALPCVGSM